MDVAEPGDRSRRSGCRSRQLRRKGRAQLCTLPGSHRNEVSQPVVDGPIDDHMHAIALTVVVDAMRVAQSQILGTARLEHDA